MARIQKGQSYEDLGFRVDDKGIAYDLTTGAGIPKKDVDARLAGSGMSQLGKRRGGIAGSLDRNKKWALPAVEFGAQFLPGVGPLVSAGIGAAAKGLDRPGEGGIGFDPKAAAMGGLQGYAVGKLGDMGSNALASGAGGATGPVGASDIANATVHETSPSWLSKIGSVGSKLVSGGVPGLPSLGKVGDSIKDAVTGNNGMNALAFAQLLNAAQLGKKSGSLADEALNTQRDQFAQKAPLRAQGIAGMQAPRTQLPQLAKLGAVANPFARTV